MINWHFLKVGWLGFNDAFNTDWVKAAYPSFYFLVFLFLHIFSCRFRAVD